MRYTLPRKTLVMYGPHMHCSSVKFGIFEKKLGESDKFIGLAYHGKNIVFRFIIEYSSLKDFGP